MIRLGMLTPSSNTVLEPQTAALLAGTSGITAHFSRFRVTEIALDAGALGQFDASPMLSAAELLSHAKVDSITWNGTSASWMGLDADRRLAAAITERTGVQATTCVLTLVDWLKRQGLRRIGLVSPYTDDVVDRIKAVYGAEGLPIVAERHLSVRDNFSFGLVAHGTIADMVAGVAREGADCAVILCTNMEGAVHAPAWEAEWGLPVLDSVSVSLYGALRAVGADTGAFAHWGRLFAA